MEESVTTSIRFNAKAGQNTCLLLEPYFDIFNTISVPNCGITVLVKNFCKSVHTHFTASGFRHCCSATSHVLSGCNSGIHASPDLPSDDFASGDTITSSKAGRFCIASSIAAPKSSVRSTRRACMPKARAMAAWSANCHQVPTTLPCVSA